jgi:hypothetical protein
VDAMRRCTVFLTLAFLAIATAASAQVYFRGVVAQPHAVRPKTLNLSADGTLEVVKLHWASWGGRVATGYGRAYYHGCTPNCAEAKTHHRSVTVRLSAPRRCSHRSYYNHVVLLVGKAGHRRVFIRPAYQHWAPC